MSIRRILSALILLLASCAATPAHATTAVVPDSFPTIQAGIESWRDTVLVRGGHYDEDPVLRVGVTLAAIPSDAGADTVEMTGLRIADWIPQFEPRVPRPDRSLIDVRGFHLAGRVRRERNQDFYYGYQIAFTACRMDSGLTLGPSSIDHSVTIDSCTIFNGLSIDTYSQATVTNSTILGGGIFVHAEGTYLIRGNDVYGPAAYGIRAWTDGNPELSNNTVAGADVGVYVTGGGRGCGTTRSWIAPARASSPGARPTSPGIEY